MKKLLNKIRVLVSMVIVNFILFTSNVYAESADPLENPNYFKPNDLTNAGKVKTIGNTIIGGIQFLGSIISVIILIIIGIKFIYGSAEERAEYKESMKPYLIGALMLFSITNILAIISEILA